ncbi:MAG: proteasome assembly chaperone family protein [Candidatus Micrarchaeia archaeon]
MIEVKLFNEYKLKGYTLIEGFPGAGLVGPMVNSYIIEKLGMDYIGYIDSNEFPSVIAIHKGIPMFPVRLYKDDKHKLVVIIAEFTIPPELIYELANELMNFVRKSGIKEIVSIGGMPADEPKEVAYGIASEGSLGETLKKIGIAPIEDGVVAGVSALLLANSQQYNIPVVELLVQVNPQIMDPKYAVTALINLKKLLGIEISTDELEREAKIVEAKVRETLKRTRDSHESYKKAVDATGPSMYA